MENKWPAVLAAVAAIWKIWLSPVSQKRDPTKSVSFVQAVTWGLLAEFEWMAGHEPSLNVVNTKHIISLDKGCSGILKNIEFYSFQQIPADSSLILVVLSGGL